MDSCVMDGGEVGLLGLMSIWGSRSDKNLASYL